MAHYPIPATYNFGMTYFRNFYNNRIIGGRQGAKAIRVLQKHLEYSPTWNTYDQEEVSTTDEEGTITITYEDITTEPSVACNGAIDIVTWLKGEINNDDIECTTSFICSLVRKTGLISKEDLELLVDHKQNYVRSTERGKKLVSQYHRVGSVLERKMESDLYRHTVYKYLYDNWLEDVVRAVKLGNFDIAEMLYFEAIRYLAKRYGMEDKIDDFAE